MPELILLTGATGNIGFQILLKALEAGYHVRCAVRSEAKAGIITSHQLIKQLKIPSDALTFVTVPDIAIQNAYDEAIKGCQYAIHVATVVPMNVVGEPASKGEELFVIPAVKSTVSVLQASKKEAGVKRVVICSSAVAIVPWEVWAGKKPSNGKIYKPEDRNMMNVAGPFETLSHGYIAGKTAALREAEAWMSREQPAFDLVNIHPGFVIGRNFLARDEKEVKSGTNTIALTPALGFQSEDIKAGSCCWTPDVAETHVRALSANFEGVKKGECKSFALSTPVEWDDVCGMAKRLFPQAVGSGTLPLGGHMPACRADVDSSETEKLLGHKLGGIEEQVKSLFGHYLEVTGVS